LIEDLFDALTISESERMWAVVESMTDRLTNPDLFAKGIIICSNLGNKWPYVVISYWQANLWFLERAMRCCESFPSPLIQRYL
jgi:hypothetical protein